MQVNRRTIKLPQVSPRELAAILAALRVCSHGMFNDAYRVTEHWDGVGKPLSADALDTLCERLNKGELKR